MDTQIQSTKSDGGGNDQHLARLFLRNRVDSNSNSESDVLCVTNCFALSGAHGFTFHPSNTQPYSHSRTDSNGIIQSHRITHSFSYTLTHGFSYIVAHGFSNSESNANPNPLGGCPAIYQLCQKVLGWRVLCPLGVRK